MLNINKSRFKSRKLLLLIVSVVLSHFTMVSSFARSFVDEVLFYVAVSCN